MSRKGTRKSVSRAHSRKGGIMAGGIYAGEGVYAGEGYFNGEYTGKQLFKKVKVQRSPQEMAQKRLMAQSRADENPWIQYTRRIRQENPDRIIKASDFDLNDYYQSPEKASHIPPIPHLPMDRYRSLAKGAPKPKKSRKSRKPKSAQAYFELTPSGRRSKSKKAVSLSKSAAGKRAAKGNQWLQFLKEDRVSHPDASMAERSTRYQMYKERGQIRPSKEEQKYESESRIGSFPQGPDFEPEVPFGYEFRSSYVRPQGQGYRSRRY